MAGPDPASTLAASPFRTRVAHHLTGRAAEPRRHGRILCVARPGRQPDLASALSPWCANLVPSESARGALNHLRREQFPVALLDWHLPDMSAIDLCRTMRQVSGHERTFILIIGGPSTREVRRQALAAGADNYLSEPLDLDMLRVRVDVAMERAHRLAEAEKTATVARGLLEAVAENAPLVVFVLDRDGTITFAGGLGLRAMGLSAEGMVGRSAFDVAQHRPDIMALVRRTLAGEALTATVTLAGRVSQARQVPRQDEHGTLDGMISVAIDVTDHMRREAGLQTVAAHLCEALLGLSDAPMPPGSPTPISAPSPAASFRSVIPSPLLDPQSGISTNRWAGLTPRERQLLDLILQGRNTASIADELCLSPNTVRNYLATLYDKLGVHSRAEAISLILTA